MALALPIQPNFFSIGKWVPSWSVPDQPYLPLKGYTAVYGGSYDPPHLGHLAVAQTARDVLGADKVSLMPAFRHPDKTLAPFSLRLEMTQALLQCENSGDIEVSADERKADASGQTYDMIHWLKKNRPNDKLALLIGSDLLATIHLWDDWPKLKELIPIVVVPRAGTGATNFFTSHPPLLPAISSTTVRQKLYGGAAVDELIPSAVLQVIKREGLYRP